MGVHKFYGAFVKDIRGVATNELPRLFGLIMDLNGLAHRVAQEIFGYGKKLNNEELTDNEKFVIRRMLSTKEGFNQLKMSYLLKFKETLSKIIFENLNPTDFLIMTLDGKAPFAKCKQQLGRRTNAGIERHRSNDGINTSEKFDTAYLTAGLPFMNDLSKTIDDWIGNNKHVLPHFTMYSGTGVEGEGEHKMFRCFEDLKKNIIDTYQGSAGKNISDVISKQPIGVYGSDADIGILCMRRDYNFLWIREPYNVEHFQEFIIVDSIRLHVLNRMLEGIDRNIVDRQKEMNVIEDFTLLSFVIGDDFVPAHFPLTINVKTTFDQIMFMYSQMVTRTGFITSGDEINIPALTSIFEGLVDIEREMYKTRQLVNEIETSYVNYYNTNGQEDVVLAAKRAEMRRINKIKISPDEYYNSAPILNLSYEDYCQYWKKILRRPCLFSNIVPTSDRIQSETFLTDEQLDTNCDEACQDYITGLRWNFAYYRGKDVNNWFYKRTFPPTIHAVANFLKAGKYVMEPVIRNAYDPVISTTQVLAMVLNPHLNEALIHSQFGSERAYSKCTINCRFLKVNSPVDIACSYQGKYKSEEHSKILLLPQIIIEDVMRVINIPSLEERDPYPYKVCMGGKPGIYKRIFELGEYVKPVKKPSLAFSNTNIVAEIPDKDDEEKETIKMSTPSIVPLENHERKGHERDVVKPKMPGEIVETKITKIDSLIKERTSQKSKIPQNLDLMIEQRNRNNFQGRGRGRGQGRGPNNNNNSMKVGKFRLINTNNKFEEQTSSL